MYKILLQACGNPDHMENPYGNIVNGNAVRENQKICDTIKECQLAAREYIEENDLGAGNWSGGFVFDENNNQVGYVSYNGKYWEKGSKYYLER